MSQENFFLFAYVNHQAKANSLLLSGSSIAIKYEDITNPLDKWGVGRWEENPQRVASATTLNQLGFANFELSRFLLQHQPGLGEQEIDFGLKPISNVKGWVEIFYFYDY